MTFHVRVSTDETARTLSQTSEAFVFALGKTELYERFVEPWINRDEIFCDGLEFDPRHVRIEILETHAMRSRCPKSRRQPQRNSPPRSLLFSGCAWSGGDHGHGLMAGKAEIGRQAPRRPTSRREPQPRLSPNPAPANESRKCARADSNGRPLAPEASALSTELRAQTTLQGADPSVRSLAPRSLHG
jgi:hypothetical protein